MRRQDKTETETDPSGFWFLDQRWLGIFVIQKPFLVYDIICTVLFIHTVEMKKQLFTL